MKSNNHVRIYFDGIKDISERLNKKDINDLVKEISNIKKRGGRIFFLGVGGSAGNASHAVNDFRKICEIESYTPTDNVSEFSARINDDGWNRSFSEWLRIEQAEKQKQFLQQLKLDKQIEKFRVREVKELEKLEKISLREKREDYAGLQQRIEKLKEKYRIIRDQKIRERVEALGVKIQGDEDRETLLQKEKEYTLARQKIEFALESFYRSASSLVFQLNKRHITRHMSIFRCIDRRFETGEIFVKWDEASDDEWLLLIYIKNNSPDEGIVIEDKTNPEKNISHEFKNNEIFKASDTMVDALTQLIARKRAKNIN